MTSVHRAMILKDLLGAQDDWDKYKTDRHLYRRPGSLPFRSRDSLQLSYDQAYMSFMHRMKRLSDESKTMIPEETKLFTKLCDAAEAFHPGIKEKISEWDR